MPIFVKDPCGWLVLLIVYVACAYVDFVVCYWIVFKSLWGTALAIVHLVCFNALLLCILLSHIRAVCADPGIVPYPFDTGEEYRGVALPPSEMLENHAAGRLSGADSEPHLRLQQQCLENYWTECKKCRMLRELPKAHFEHTQNCNE